MKQITYDKALELLERAVAERGEDYVYPESEKRRHPTSPDLMCSYFTPDDEPSCIIGQVLSYLGHSAEEVAPREGQPGTTVLMRLGYEMEREANILLSGCQSEQDDGTAWGAALRSAKGRVERATKEGWA